MSNQPMSESPKPTSAASPKTTRMPRGVDVMRIVHQVVPDLPFSSAFYAVLYCECGKQLSGDEFAILLHTAMRSFAQKARLDQKDLTDFLQSRLGMIADLFIDDDKVKADAKRAFEQIDSLNAELSVEPSDASFVPRIFLGVNDKRDLVAWTRRIVDAYDQATPDLQARNVSCRREGLHAHHSQTSNGFFLAFEGHQPSKLWLPWGAFTFNFDYASDEQINTFLARLELKRTLPNRTSIIGTLNGSVYAVLALDGERLPVPVQLTDRRQLRNHHDAQEEWHSLYNVG